LNWLFGHSPRLPQETRHQSREEREEEISRARHEALEHIMRTGGLPKVLELAEKEAVLPHVVGSVLGKATLLDSDVEILPSLLSSDNKKLANFAAGYARERFNNAGWVWIEQLGLSEWTAEEAGYFAVEALPFERRTWELVA
jgi:hypothetical protein